MTNLQKLYCFNCSISQLPKSIGNLKKLQELFGKMDYLD